MNRITILQNFIDSRNYKTYLEIGTWKGDSFFPIKCHKKIAVDPTFKISKRTKQKWILKNPRNFFNSYFEMTSKEFFERKGQWLNRKYKPDIIFIDGLHTFQASLNDVLHSLKYLDPNGTIIVHDCFPPNKAAATPAESIEDADRMQIEGWKKEWCGDVWKTIIYLKLQHNKELDIFVLNTDYGLGVIRRKLKDSISTLINQDLYDRINRMDYEYMVSNPRKHLGLREV